MHQPFGMREVLLAFLVLAVAAALRVGYLLACVQDLQQPPPFQVQDPQTAITVIRGKTADARPMTEHDQLVKNIADANWYGSKAPLADQEEATAHVSPGYVSVVGYALRWVGDASRVTQIIIWTQCVLGSLTAVFYFLFARLAFGNVIVGVFAGLLAAIHPFWLVNVAELQDGTLACFLLAGCLYLGTAAAKGGNPLASFLFGGALAGLTLVRAALLPFSIVACIWVLLHCRRQPRGWLCALLIFLGFGNGLAPWTIRNFQVFNTVVPITDNMFLDMWVGNNRLATGGPQSESALRQPLTPERVKDLLAENNQATRYRKLADDVRQSISANPAASIERRFRSGLSFIFGNAWMEFSGVLRGIVGGADEPGLPTSTLMLSANRDDTPAWIKDSLPTTLAAALFLTLTLGFLGWRWSYGNSRASNLASLAMICVPLPYILTHADFLSGSRLPLDGVLLCYAAFALAWMLPGGKIISHPLAY